MDKQYFIIHRKNFKQLGDGNLLSQLTKKKLFIILDKMI
jgi:hypothetical protein